MKITIDHDSVDENEVILRCKTIDQEMLKILTFLQSQAQKISVYDQNNDIILLSTTDVYYCESVDEKVFLYTAQDVYRISLTLSQLENYYSLIGLFRISKSTVVNLNKIFKIKSLTSGRIALFMNNEEKIIVSRRYAAVFRARLDEGGL